MFAPSFFPPFPGSNRTIVGLKLKLAGADRRNFPSQQSHHCGIETAQTPYKRLSTVQQQSHHCGIETATVITGELGKFDAAIAPLWD